MVWEIYQTVLFEDRSAPQTGSRGLMLNVQEDHIKVIKGAVAIGSRQKPGQNLLVSQNEAFRGILRAGASCSRLGICHVSGRENRWRLRDLASQRGG